jgi:hypothetical protein
MTTIGNQPTKAQNPAFLRNAHEDICEKKMGRKEDTAGSTLRHFLFPVFFSDPNLNPQA